MRITWNIERCPSGRPYVDLRVTRGQLRGRRLVSFDLLLWTRRVLIDFTH